MKKAIACIFSGIMALYAKPSASVIEGSLFLKGEAEGVGQGKHIVLVAGDEEYRSEEAMPMLAQILAKQGFDCSVLFSLDKKGVFVDPNNNASLSYSKAFDTADAIVLSIRFRSWSEQDMQRFDAAMKRGVSIIGLRTTTHGFSVKKDSPYAHYSKNSRAQNWRGGFGRQILGEAWAGHHGAHKTEGTRTHLEEANKDHAILNGVGTITCETDVYGAKPLEPATILLRGEVTESFDPESPGVASKNNPMQPVAWTRGFPQPNGATNKVFTSTMGAASDFLDEDLRRLVINGIYWSVGLNVPEKVDVSFQSTYKPSFYSKGIFQKNKRPEDFLSVEVGHNPMDYYRDRANEVVK